MKSRVAAASPNLSSCCDRAVVGHTPSIPCSEVWPCTKFSLMDVSRSDMCRSWDTVGIFHILFPFP